MKKLSLFLVLFFAEILVFGSMSVRQVKALNSANGPVAWYPFNANANDESGNGNNGTVNGAVLSEDQSGMNDQAYQFDGISNYIAVPNNPTIVLTDELSITAWVRRTRFGIDMILEKGGDWTYGNCNYGMSLHYLNNNMFYFFFNGGWRGTDGVNDFEWHHYAIVAKNGDTNPLLYIDGQLKTVQYSEGAATINLTSSTSDLHIGAQLNPTYFGANVIDDVRIYNRILSPSEISELAANINIIAYYPFNGNANDESGNENNPTYIGSDVTLTSDRFGNPDRAYYFDGNADSYIRIPADKFPTTDRTISFWFNADQLDNHPTPLSYGGETCYNSVLMIINKGDSPNAYTVLSHCGSNFISAPYSEAPVNKWYYVTMTISGATQKIFINGELQQTANTFNTPTVVTGKSAIIGALLFTDGNTVYIDPSAGNFQGKLDDFRFYATAMTDAEVRALYTSEAYGLVANYPFNGNADDVSGNLNHGVVNNAVLTSDRYGVADKAYSFNGIDSYIEGMDPGKNLPIGNSSRSFAAWVKDNVYQYYGSNIFHYGTMEAAPTNFHFLITDVLGLGNGYGYGVTYGKTNLIDSTWHFVCATYDSTNRLVKLFIDGKPDNSEALSTAPNTVLATKWKIGLFMAGGTSFNGKLDEIRVFKTALSEQEIQYLYSNETTAPTLQLPVDKSSVTTLTPTMQWSSSLPGAEFRFQLSSDSLFTTLLQDVTTTSQNAQIPEGIISEGINYFWQVRTTVNGETGPWSDHWKFDFINTRLEGRIPNMTALSVSPNPADAWLNIYYTVQAKNASKVPVNIEILNSIGLSTYKTGAKSMLPGNYELKVAASSLQPGVYYCRLRVGHNSVVCKLVILH